MFTLNNPSLAMSRNLIKDANVALSQAIETLTAVTAALKDTRASLLAGRPDQLDTAGDRSSENCPMLPKADVAVLSVCVGDHVCFLGNTLPFWLIARLLKRPNHYLPYSTLMDEVWKGPRSASAIRSVVRELRAKLRDAGLHQVANAIHGNVPGHYAYLHRPKL